MNLSEFEKSSTIIPTKLIQGQQLWLTRKTKLDIRLKFLLKQRDGNARKWEKNILTESQTTGWSKSKSLARPPLIWLLNANLCLSTTFSKAFLLFLQTLNQNIQVMIQFNCYKTAQHSIVGQSQSQVSGWSISSSPLFIKAPPRASFLILNCRPSPFSMFKIFSSRHKGCKEGTPQNWINWTLGH